MLLLSISVPGKPQGAKRHRAARRGSRVVTFHDADHLDAEERIRRVAAHAWHGSTHPADRPPLDRPVAIEITTWHARPARMRRRKDAGSWPVPYTGKPDADNVAKLVMDALTKAGVWTDDTRVADLVVRRRYLALGADCLPIGVERVEIRVLEAS